MARIKITPTDEKHWHSLRAKNLNSTDAAALFGMSPYKTKFELWHEKRSGDVDHIADNERMAMGRAIEPVIAAEFGRRYGVKVRALNLYVFDDVDRIGASYDFEIVGLVDGWTGTDSSIREMYEKHGAGILEVKNVDWLVHRNNWQDGEDAEAPEHIEIQAQHQLEAFGTRKWVAIAALVGGNNLKVIVREYDREVGEAIRIEARKFWMTVHANEPPPPTYPDDADAVIAMYQFASPGRLLDLRDDAEVAALCAEYHEALETAKESEERKRTARAQLLERVGDAEKILTDGFQVSLSLVSPSKGKEVTEDMVGTYIGARAGYRGFRLTKKKEAPTTTKE